MYNKLMQDYLANNKMFSFEGERGIKHMEKIATEVCGYSNAWEGTLKNFFADNPGAIEAVVEWIGNQRCSDWKDNLESLVGPEEEPEVGDLAPPEEADLSDIPAPPTYDPPRSWYEP
jgi:hypothetical protein